jgi:hypothetical protein
MGMFQMRGDDLIQPAMAVQVQIVRSSQQVHRKDQPHQSQIVISVKVGDKDVIDPVKVRLKTHELHLRALPTVNKKVTVFDFDQLRRRISSVRRQSATRTEYGDIKTHLDQLNNSSWFRLIMVRHVQECNRFNRLFRE